MKELQDKLDNIKLEFDEEKLWTRIQKPKKKRRPVILLLIGFSAITILSIYFIQIDASEPTADLFSLSANITEDPFEEEACDTIYDHRFTSALHPMIQHEVDEGYLEKSISKFLERKEDDSSTQREVSNALVFTKQDKTILPEKIDENAEKNKQPSAYERPQISFVQTIRHLPPRPYQLDALKSNGFHDLDLSVLHQAKKEEDKGLVKNKLTISTGVGWHVNHFNADDAIRDFLENERSNIHINLGYSRVLQSNFLVYSQLSFVRYHDEIDVIGTREQFEISNMKISSLTQRTHYNIHNYYSILSLSLGIGKNWHLNNRHSINVSGGLGTLFFTKANADALDSDFNIHRLENPYNNQNTHSPYLEGRLDWNYALNPNWGVFLGVSGFTNQTLLNNVHEISSWRFSLGVQYGF